MQQSPWLPARAADAPGGHAFAEAIRGLGDDERELRIQHELQAANIPKCLRQHTGVYRRPCAGGDRRRLAGTAVPAAVG
jgi:hypothetical protein